MKVTVNFDTVTKKIEVMQNGQAVDNLEAVCFYRGYYYDDDDKDKFTMELRQYEQDKEEGVRRLSSTMAQLLK